MGAVSFRAWTGSGDAAAGAGAANCAALFRTQTSNRADWHDTAYPEDVVRAWSHDPRQPSGYEKQLIQQGYGATAAFILAQDPSIVESGQVRRVG